jgi:hypothetical protein
VGVEREVEVGARALWLHWGQVGVGFFLWGMVVEVGAVCAQLTLVVVAKVMERAVEGGVAQVVVEVVGV